MKHSMYIVVLIALSAGWVSAQPRLGDLIVCDNSLTRSVAYIDRTSGILTSLSATFPAGPIGITMAKNNTDLIALGGGNVWSIDPTGVLTTVTATGTGGNTGCDLRQDGTYALSASVYGSTGFVKIVDPVTRTVTTLYQTGASHYRAAAVNQDNDSLLVCRWDVSGDLLEFDMVNRTLRTVRSGYFGLNDVDVEPATGNFVCSVHYAGGRLEVVTPGGSVVTTISVAWGSGIKVEDSTGHYLYATGSGSSTINTVLELDAQGKTIRTYGPYTGYNLIGVDVYGSKQVTGRGAASPGAAFRVDFSFPGLGGTPYVSALAFSQRPGFPIGGGTLNLQPDALFWLTLQGLFVSNFQGTLDRAGRAVGTVNIPSFMPKGFTIYCAAIATNGVNFVIGNTLGITVN